MELTEEEEAMRAGECGLPGRRQQAPTRSYLFSKNSKANPIETGERSGGIGEICSVEVDEK
jgi:hypothetical protein